MNQTFRDSYFSSLPNEVLLNILHNVDTFSVLNFCAVYDCDYFLQEKNVVRTVDLCRQYKLPAITEVARKIACESVTTLNLNGVYWVAAAKLRKFIGKFENVEVLYAVHTNLSFTDADLDTLKHLQRLRKLGVSVGKSEKLGYQALRFLDTLYVHITNLGSICFRSLLLIIPTVRHVWMEIEKDDGGGDLLNILGNNCRTKIFCQVDCLVPFIDYKHESLTTYYSNRRVNQPYVICCEKFEPGQIPPESTVASVHWQTLHELHYRTPYGPKDARRLWLHENTLDDVVFEELNFYHAITCCSRGRTAIEEILKSANARHLERLCVMMCLFHTEDSRPRDRQQDSNGFERKRIGVDNSMESHPVEQVFGNFLGLKHLDIPVCNEFVSNHSVIAGYSFISLFEHLESLTVEVPVTVDGRFLAEVLNKCKNLQVLKVTSAGRNEKLNYHIWTSIPNATALKDFRYESRRIRIDKLLHHLCLMKNKTLERIVLSCQETDRFSQEPFQEFLDLNPQLVFLYFLITCCTEASIRYAQETLNSYKKKDPSKIFFIKKTDVFKKAGFPIPDVHFYEMIDPKRDVATLRPLEHFESF